MNTEVHKSERTAWENGYREALLDVYCFLTANPQAFDLEEDRFALIQNMVQQVNEHPHRLLVDQTEDIIPFLSS